METHVPVHAAALEELPRRTPTMHEYMGRLGTLLGRRWCEGDIYRTIACLEAVTDGRLSLEDGIQRELFYLREETEEPEQLAATLLGYYRLFLEAWPVATEVHSVPVAMTEMEDWEMEDWETEEEEEEEEEVIYYSVRERPYEEIVREQLRTRNIEKEEERDADEEEICCVCLQDLYRGSVATLNCRHEFHVDCITRWLVGGKNFCPLCRARAIRHER